MTLVEHASLHVWRRLAGPVLGLVFMALSMVYAGSYALGEPRPFVFIIAAALAAYMAMNIGANDVTNNTGAAVGARALGMNHALLLAAVFEVLGAVIGGREVTGTIAGGIVPPGAFADAGDLVIVMLAALSAAALWINLATWLNAPVSTTHSIIGAIIGAAASAGGLAVVDWRVIGEIVMSWVASPVLGGVIAATMLYFIEERILARHDKIAAARRWVPVLLALMAGAFSAYLALQFALRGWLPKTLVAPLGLGVALLSWLAFIPAIARQSAGLENRNASMRVLFQMPLIASSAVLCFAHGANDVSNAIGPLAAIAAATGKSGASALSVPTWAVFIGAFGISAGLLLFGPRLIRLVGEQITKLNPVRSYCVSLSAALTVLGASYAGLPVSSTHIAVGSVFGVGFFREWYTRRKPPSEKARKPKKQDEEEFEGLDHAVFEQQNAEELRRRLLVRRSHFMTIAGAWMITLPASAGVAALMQFLYRSIGL